MSKMYLYNIELVSELQIDHQKLHNDLTWVLQSVVTEKAESNKTQIKSNVLASQSIAELTDTVVTGNYFALGFGSSAYLSSTEISNEVISNEKKSIQLEFRHKECYEVISFDIRMRKEFRKTVDAIKFKAVAFNKRITLEDNAREFLVQHMNDPKRLQILDDLKGLCYSDPVNCTVIVTLKGHNYVFITLEEINNKQPQLKRPRKNPKDRARLLQKKDDFLSNTVNCIQGTMYCPHGKHAVNSGLKKRNQRLYCPIHINMWIRGSISHFGDFRKIPRTEDYKSVTDWFSLDLEEVLSKFGIKEDFFLKYYNLSSFDDIYEEGSYLSEQSIIASVEDYLIETTIDKDVDVLKDIFCEDHSFFEEVLQEFQKTDDPIWICIVELYYSKMNPITKEKLEEHFHGNVSVSQSIDIKHPSCEKCCLDGQNSKAFIRERCEDDLNDSTKENYIIIYHGSNGDTWIEWLDRCVPLRQARAGDFNLIDESAFYCSFDYASAEDMAFKRNNRNFGVVVSYWLHRDYSKDSNFYNFETTTDKWEKSIVGYRRNPLIDNDIRAKLCLQGPRCGRIFQVTQGTEEPKEHDNFGHQICFKEQTFLQKYAELRSIDFILPIETT
eukprot:NODE_84_length_22349_cov_0.357888.p1 type:complete len:610 gc:universal NODE_84_length_22349_cov_0.357888:19824-21653(+)